MTTHPSIDKFYENTISAALMFKTRDAYGSFEGALKALMKRKITREIGYSKTDCENYFRIAIKVVEDALEFENSYIRTGKANMNSADWFDEKTISKIMQKMEGYLKERNPNAPPIFIARSIARIYYFYHLA